MVNLWIIVCLYVWPGLRMTSACQAGTLMEFGNFCDSRQRPAYCTCVTPFPLVFPSMGLVLVVPGDPGASFLMRKLTDDLPSDGSLGGPMPEGEAILWSMIPQAELDAITCWIAGGAP